MFSDLLFVLLHVSAIIFMFSTSANQGKVQSSIAEVVGSNPTRSLSFILGKYVLNGACPRHLSDRRSYDNF